MRLVPVVIGASLTLNGSSSCSGGWSSTRYFSSSVGHRESRNRSESGSFRRNSLGGLVLQEKPRSRTKIGSRNLTAAESPLHPED